METVEQARDTILKELTSRSTDVSEAYLKHFRKDVERFSAAMAEAFINWQDFDFRAKDDEKQARISTLVEMAIRMNINSMKEFISGEAVGADTRFRWAVGVIMAALLCSRKELDFLFRARWHTSSMPTASGPDAPRIGTIDLSYLPSDVIRDVTRHGDKLGLDRNGLEALGEAVTFYHERDYLDQLFPLVVVGMSSWGKGSHVGPEFDEGKLEVYAKEVGDRVKLAALFSTFVDGVKANVAKWKRTPNTPPQPS